MHRLAQEPSNHTQPTPSRAPRFVTATALALALACLNVTPGVTLAQNMGPSTTVAPYLLPSMPGVETTSILTVGNAPADNGYRMVGIPDGLGAFREGGKLTVLMNHELTATQGIMRAHGSQGAFVSRWSINPKNFKVLKGDDLTSSANDVMSWDPITGQYVKGTTVWQRLCSADLALPTAFFYKGKGTEERIFMDGEEANGGRAWARVATGKYNGDAWELPRLGKNSYENVVASPYPQNKTVVMLMDDGNLNTAPVAANFPSQLSVYIGEKVRKGHPVEQAGLTNGKLYGLKLLAADGTPIAEESNEFGLGNTVTGYVGAGKFALVELGDHGNVSALSGLQQEQGLIDADVTRLQRIEDGVWDPRRRHGNDFYFVTTASFTSNSRLWRVRFEDIEHPERGGIIEILLKGDEQGHKMFDNITMDRCGRILLQEDPGNNSYLARVWVYGTKSGKLIEIAHHDPARFDPTIPPPPTFLTQDEESSGIIDASHLMGKGWFLLDVQVHGAITDPELVENGQLLALRVDSAIECDRDRDDDDKDTQNQDHDEDKGLDSLKD